MMKPDDTFKRVFRDYLEAFLFAIVIAIILRTFFVGSYKVPTNSMAPTLRVGDFLLASKTSYGLRIPILNRHWPEVKQPHRGDVVVFTCPKSPNITCVKRVVGLPGDRIQIIKKNLVVNNLKANYSQNTESDFFDPLISAESAVVTEELRSVTHEILIESADESENFGPVIVPPGHFFVLGDARDRTEDSRVWGSLPLKSLRGRVFLVWMSLDWSENWQNGKGPNVRWDRIFTRVH